VIAGTQGGRPTSPSEEPAPAPKPFTQESLVAFVDLIQCTRQASKSVEGNEWALDRLTRLMAILKGMNLSIARPKDWG
jgi:hypothetical protein